ncbi:hypothetical protein BMT55_11750 [Listeria newyorkensis]|uniref:HTH cro/C1-type domain-containing protein n=1 Tax=Listeria newyorkensis TaxID=1497681 RepID=A0ABX4XLK1_9LIST|nr:helix-turn-helix transcriptional regulator [Listeria newyorkensis]PNP90645.1 hypothetical protein BMT55_11750 [Listeria newyorkensis]
MKKLGIKLKSARENKQMTQKQVAEKLDISIGTLSGYERNYRDPDTNTLQKLADLYEVSIDALMGRDQNKVNDIPVKDLAFDNLEGLTKEDLAKVNDYILMVKRHREEINKIENNLKENE